MEEHGSSTGTSSAGSGRAPGRWRRCFAAFFVVLLILALILFSAPWILSTPPARRLILQQVNRAIDGTVSIQSWSIRWTRGIEINGIRFTTREADLCFEAGGVRIGFSIPMLARAAYAFHNAEIGRPIDAELEGQINLFRGRICAGTGPSAATLVTDLNALLKIEALDKPWSFVLSGKADQEGGSIAVTGTVHALPNGAFEPEAIKGNIALKVQELNVTPIIILMFGTNGLLPDIATYLGGALTVNMVGMNEIDAKGELALWPTRTSEINVSEGRQTFDTIDLQIDVAKKGPEVAVRTLAVDCSLFRAAASGALTLSSSNTLSKADLKIEGGVDLGEAMVVLPDFLPIPIPPDLFVNTNAVLGIKGLVTVDMSGKTNLTDAISGTVTANLSGLDIGPFMAMAGSNASLPKIEGTLEGQLAASIEGIEALNAKGRITLESLRMSGGIFGSDTPFMETARLDFDLARAGKKVMIRTCSLNSPLFDARLSGEVQPLEAPHLPEANLVITGKVNAAAVAREFPHTLNLQKDLTLSDGSLDISALCRTVKENLVFEGTLKTSDLTARKQGQDIRLDKPVVLFAGGAVGRKTFQLDRFELSSSFLSGQGSGNLEGMKLSLTADLATAVKEASKFIDLGGKSGGGQLAIDASISTLDPLRAKLSAEARLSNLHMSGFTARPIRLDSLRIDLGAVADLDESKQFKDITDVSLSAQSDFASVTMTGEALTTDKGGNPAARKLDLKAESDFSRLMPFLRSITEIPNDMEITGKARASAECSLKNNVLNMPKLDICLSPFTFRRSNGLTVDKTVLASGNLSLPIAAKTAIERLRQTDADSMLSVEFAKYLGIQVSDLKVPLRMKNGLLELNIEIGINQGKLTLPLRVDAGKEPTILEIPDNTQILQGVKLTDEMVNELLAFVSPLLKGCAVSSGSLSARIKRCRIPLGKADAGSTEFEGTSSFRSVTLGPAGLLFDILSLAELQNELITVPDQDVQSQHRNGRIYSSPLKLKTGDYDIIISGSVGLDETLDYMAKIPITRKMVGKDAYEYLKGKSISLPIGGTVRKPAFDKMKFLAETAKIAADTGTQKVIEKGVEQGGKLIEKGIEEGEKLLQKWLKQ